jgi:CHAT domain-containing protein
VLTGRDASKAALAAAATAATHIHIATHGYLAPELADANLGGGVGVRMRLAPQVLCGLALALANERGPNLTSQPGIVTAEELAAWSLDRCELVVLSACEGSRGAGLRGQSLASVRSALRIAGARHVVASSWRVDDDATRQLMADFYELLLAEPPARRDPQRALWLARLRARDRGAQFRDWAGWTVTGR